MVPSTTLAPVAESVPSAMDTKEDTVAVTHSLHMGDDGIVDIDTDFEDPQLASEYTKDIYTYMRQLEVVY